MDEAGPRGAQRGPPPGVVSAGGMGSRRSDQCPGSVGLGELVEQRQEGAPDPLALIAVRSPCRTRSEREHQPLDHAVEVRVRHPGQSGSARSSRRDET